MWKKALFCLLLCLSILEAKPPQITARDVKVKVDEILKTHACHKSLSHELMQRALSNFLDELDPTKTYLLHAEIAPWADPSEETLAKVLADFKKGQFSAFEEIQAVFVSAVARRNALENDVAGQTLPKGVKSEEFKDLPWATSQEELSSRLLRIKALQADATQKLDETSQQKLMQRLAKRRLNREQELVGGTAEETSRTLLANVLKATAASLDGHTNYFTPHEASQFMIQVQQRLFGIGAQLRDELDGLAVVRILENSPASESRKIKINDKIIAVNQEPIIGMEITEAVELIRGEKGTPVLLTILRGEEKLEIELVRNEVVLEETRFETIVEPYGDGAIAVLKLFSFYEDPRFSSAGDLRKAIEQVKADYPLKAVVLDLRSNAGGLLRQAVHVSGLFMNRGIVVSVKDNTGKVSHEREKEGRPVWNGPLFVLVNRASASAAEIVAQTLQDYGRAIVIGDEFSYGKGSYQTFTLDAVHNPKVNPQGEYKVTRGRYYTVSGKSPQLTGVQSDIVVPGLLSQLDIGEKFGKFPLENDEIDPHFEDDLSDLTPFQRIQLGANYKYNLQQRLTTYVPYMEKLRDNSAVRIGAHKHYQNFLTEAGKKNFDDESIELFSQTDLQLTETLNVVKDLLFLMH